MRKYVDGEYLDMTEDEIQEMKDRMPEIPEPSEMQSDRIVAMLTDIKDSLSLIKTSLGLG